MSNLKTALLHLRRERSRLASQLPQPNERHCRNAMAFAFFVIAVVGFGVNAIWQVKRADPIAAPVIVSFILRQAWKAMLEARHC